MDDSTFLAYKSAALFATFVLMGVLQGLAPYRGSYREVIRNWRVNLPLATINSAILGAICGGCVCSVAIAMAKSQVGFFHQTSISLPVQVVASVVVLDFLAWGWHRANHVIPLLWRFHAVHHSDVVFDVSTALRFHLGELVASLLVRVAVVVTIGLPVAGILAFEIVFGVFNLFVHGNVTLPRPIERVAEVAFVTPALHRWHHAARVSSSNFGTILSIWDRVGRTFEACRSSDSVRVGLDRVAIDPFKLIQIMRIPLR